MTKYVLEREPKSIKNKNGDNNTAETTKQKEFRLKEQIEQRKALELELKKQQQEWRKKKDIAKLIKWFLDSIESDED
ncbi:MAG: hypothetical protein QXU18_08875 [Thermoplasmatales archaeon]